MRFSVLRATKPHEPTPERRARRAGRRVRRGRALCVEYVVKKWPMGHGAVIWGIHLSRFARFSRPPGSLCELDIGYLQFLYLVARTPPAAGPGENAVEVIYIWHSPAGARSPPRLVFVKTHESFFLLRGIAAPAPAGPAKSLLVSFFAELRIRGLYTWASPHFIPQNKPHLFPSPVLAQFCELCRMVALWQKI